ncbi:MAG: sugar phosphate isomerase/epimerase family protein [bacterium]|jgi:sugar phosphate isomerase/epimerase
MSFLKFSVCSIGLRHKRADEAFRIIANSGFNYVDILTYSPDAHISIDMELCQRQEVLKSAEKQGVSICSLAGSGGYGFNSPDENVRKQEIERVKREIDLASEVGAAVIRVCPGHGEDLQEIRSAILPCLKEVTAYAEERESQLGMENHGGSIACKPAQAVSVCREVGSPYLGVIYEPGNLFGALEDYKRGFTEQKEHIVHVHLKDGYPHYFGEDGFEPQRIFCTLLGEGELDIPWVLESLKEMDYQGYVSVEYEFWHKEYGLPEVEEGLCRCMNYLLREDKETGISSEA